MMEMATQNSQWFTGKKVWIVRIDPGQDVLLTLQDFIREQEIQQGLIVMGYGTLSQVRLHWVTHNQFPTDNKFETWQDGFELMSMNGLIVEGTPHIHFTGATTKGAFGGHLEEGCISYVLVEVGIIELDGPPMTRVVVPVAKDAEGLQTMKTLGQNMAWLLKKIHA